jgi:hypothetical protein
MSAAMTRIVCTSYRYKRPPLWKKTVALIRGDWRHFRDDPAAIRPIFKLALLAVVVFAAAWAVVSAALLVGTVLRFV